MTLHLIKVAVGAQTVDDLAKRQKAWHVCNAAGQTVFRVRTRQTPKRQDELDGGSMYWIVKGFIAARQKILAFEQTQMDGRNYLLIHLEPEITEVERVPRGPHQGWRYFKAEDAPADLAKGAKPLDIPAKLHRELRDLALI